MLNSLLFAVSAAAAFLTVASLLRGLVFTSPRAKLIASGVFMISYMLLATALRFVSIKAGYPLSFAEASLVSSLFSLKLTDASLSEFQIRSFSTFVIAVVLIEILNIVYSALLGYLGGTLLIAAGA